MNLNRLRFRLNGSRLVNLNGVSWSQDSRNFSFFALETWPFLGCGLGFKHTQGTLRFLILVTQDHGLQT